jgi:uncharacterized membrane protein
MPATLGKPCGGLLDFLVRGCGKAPGPGGRGRLRDMTALSGTFVGRWYVTLLLAVFLWRASRHLGWSRTLGYLAAATGLGVLAENGSVHFGVPYTSYAFNPELRGQELFGGSVPLMVPLSYAFLGYFAYATGRLVASGPWRTRGSRLWQEYALGVMLSVWAIWIMDPISQMGGQWFLGELFDYEVDGFWFGLPVGSQVGFTLVSALMVGMLTWLARDQPAEPVTRWLDHPHLLSAVTYHAILVWLATMALVIGERTLGGAVLLMWVPGALVTAVLWSNLRQRVPVGTP